MTSKKKHTLPNLKASSSKPKSTSVQIVKSPLRLPNFSIEVDQEKDYIMLKQSTYAKKVLEPAECHPTKYPITSWKICWRKFGEFHNFGKKLYENILRDGSNLAFVAFVALPVVLFVYPLSLSNSTYTIPIPQSLQNILIYL